MKTTKLLLVIALAAAMLSSCALPPAVGEAEPLQEAGQTQTLSLADGVRVVAERGCAYRRCGVASRPGIKLEEGRLVLVKNKDGQVVDLWAGPARAQIVGTTILAQKRGSLLCLINVEGRTRVNWGNRVGEYRMLNAGEMLVMDEGQQTLPGPLLVNLSQLITKDELLSKKFLNSDKMALIEAAVTRQGAELAAGRLQVRSTVDGADPLRSVQGQASQRSGEAVSIRINTLASATLSGTGGTVTGLNGTTTVGGVTSTTGGVIQGTTGAVQGVTGTVGGVVSSGTSGVGNIVIGVTGAVSQVLGGLGR